MHACMYVCVYVRVYVYVCMYACVMYACVCMYVTSIFVTRTRRIRRGLLLVSTYRLQAHWFGGRINTRTTNVCTDI